MTAPERCVTTGSMRPPAHEIRPHQNSSAVSCTTPKLPTKLDSYNCYTSHQVLLLTTIMSIHTLISDSPSSSSLKKQRAPKEEIDFALDQIDMYRMRVPRDGNSLLRCMALQLYNTQMFFPKMRAALRRYMERHRTEYERQTLLTGVPTYDQYLVTLGIDGVECSALEIIALSALYQCNIYKHDSREVSRPRCVSDPSVNYPKSIFVYCPSRGSAGHGSHHYDLVLPKIKLSVTGMCQGIIYNSLYSRVYGLGSAVDIFVHLMLNNSVDPSMNASLGPALAEKLGITTDMPVGIISPSFGAHAVPDGLSHTMPTGQTIDDIRTVLQELGPPFPYKVAKSIATFVYRNPDQDVYAEKAKEKSRKRRSDQPMPSGSSTINSGFGSRDTGYSSSAGFKPNDRNEYRPQYSSQQPNCYPQRQQQSQPPLQQHHRYESPVPTFYNPAYGMQQLSSSIGSPPNMSHDIPLPSPGVPYSPPTFGMNSGLQQSFSSNMPWNMVPPATPFLTAARQQQLQQQQNAAASLRQASNLYQTALNSGAFSPLPTAMNVRSAGMTDAFMSRETNNNMQAAYGYSGDPSRAAEAFMDALKAQQMLQPPAANVRPCHFQYNSNAIAAAAATAAASANSSGGRYYQSAFFASPTPQAQGFFPLSPTPGAMAQPPHTPRIPSYNLPAMNFTTNSGGMMYNAPLSPLPGFAVSSPGLPSLTVPWSPPPFSLAPLPPMPSQVNYQQQRYRGSNFGFVNVNNNSNNSNEFGTSGLWIPPSTSQQLQQRPPSVTKHYGSRASPVNQRPGDHCYTLDNNKSSGNIELSSTRAFAASNSGTNKQQSQQSAGVCGKNVATLSPDSPASPKSSSDGSSILHSSSPMSPPGSMHSSSAAAVDASPKTMTTALNSSLTTDGCGAEKINKAFMPTMCAGQGKVGVKELNRAENNDSGLADVCISPWSSPHVAGE